MLMRPKLLTFLAVAIVAGAFAAPATAATAIGNTCTGDRAETGEPAIRTIVPLSSTSNPGALSISTAGVITKWSVNVIPYPGGISEKAIVLHPAGTNTFTVVGESTIQPILGGANTFDTRIPVQAGDRLGASSPVGSIWCEASSGPTDVMGTSTSVLQLGSTATFAEFPKGLPAVSAIVEPDVDGDGYGDETQDKCPQSATTQAPCPVLILDAVSQAPGKGSVKILVASSAESAITVSASAKLAGKGKARVSAQTKLTPINQLVTPGKIVTYVLNFTKPLKDELKALPRTKALKLKVTATGTGLAGGQSSDKLTVKLKGQAKPKK